MNPVFQLDQVSKRFGDQVALDNVSLQTSPGTVMALLGENGAGKTTAIRILLGLEQLDKGNAQVLEMDSQREGLSIRQRVGYVPERPTLYDWMTVSEVGWFTAGFFGDGFLPRYSEFTSGFGLPPRRKLKALSKGMRAKVALSLAMAHDPELLILDEPTSGLDAVVRREFLESMVDLAAQGRTILLSSHQIHEVERVADTVAIIHRGELVLVDPLDSLKQEMRQVTLTLSDDTVELPPLGGSIIAQRRQGRQWQALVRNALDDAASALSRSPGVQDVEFRAPNLEEIFVAHISANEGDDRPAPSASQEAPTP